MKRIGEIPSLADGPSPFAIVAGASAFDASCTRALFQIGYRDAAERVDEIEAFLRRGRANALPSQGAAA